jgi:hypothetical protein
MSAVQHRECFTQCLAPPPCVLDWFPPPCVCTVSAASEEAGETSAHAAPAAKVAAPAAKGKAS